MSPRVPFVVRANNLSLPPMVPEVLWKSVYGKAKKSGKVEKKPDPDNVKE